MIRFGAKEGQTGFNERGLRETILQPLKRMPPAAPPMKRAPIFCCERLSSRRSETAHYLRRNRAKETRSIQRRLERRDDVLRSRGTIFIAIVRDGGPNHEGSFDRIMQLRSCGNQAGSREHQF